MAAEIDKLLGKRRISPDEANRLRALISGTTELVDFADCDFVIEAVFEEMSIKKQVFADLEKHVSDGCVLATNTSSLSVAQMAADLDHPERVVGFHFFNPVAVLPLIEIVRGPATDDGDPRDGVRRREVAEEERRAGAGCGRFRGEPAAAQIDGGDLRCGR